MTGKSAPASMGLAVLLTALAAFGPMSIDIYLSSLPDMTRVFGTDVAMVELTLSLFLASFAAAQLVYGSLSDRFGRRRVMLAGLLVYVFASLGCLAAESIQALILWRVVQGVGACAGPVLGRAVVRDVYPRDQAARVLSYMASAMALAPVVAPIAGGWAHSLYGWRANFVVMAVYSAVVLVMVWRMLPETNPRLDHEALRPRRILGTYVRLLADRRFIGNVGTLSFSFAAMFSFISGASFVLIDILGLSPRTFGLAFAVAVWGFIAGAFLSGRLGARIGLDRLVTLGTMIGAAAGLALAGLAWAGISSLAAVIGPMVFLFLSCGLVLPNATALAIAPYAHVAGAASAAIGFVQMAAGAIAGALLGRLQDGTTRPLATAILVATLLTLLCRRLTTRQ